MLALVGETPEQRTGGGEVPDQRRIGNSQCPTAPEITIPPHLFRTLLIGRLQLPRQFTAAACQDARVLWTSWLFMHTDRQGTATSRTHRAHERHRSIPGSRHLQILAQKSAMPQQKTDLEHLVQIELVNRFTITVVLQSRSNRRCSWSLVSLFTLSQRHLDEHTRTLKHLKWVERR